MAGVLRTRVAVVLAVLVAAGACATVARPGLIRTLSKGDRFNVKGQSGRLPGQASRAVGAVTIIGRWNGGTWHFITRTRTDATGHYHFTVKPTRRGQFELRITPPDHLIQRLVLHVV